MLARLVLCCLLLASRLDAASNKKSPGEPRLPPPAELSQAFEGAGFRQGPQVDEDGATNWGTGRVVVDEGQPSNAPVTLLSRGYEKWRKSGISVVYTNFHLACATGKVDATLSLTATSESGRGTLAQVAQLVSSEVGAWCTAAAAGKKSKKWKSLAASIAENTLELQTIGPWTAAEEACFLGAIPGLLEEERPNQLVLFCEMARRGELPKRLVTALSKELAGRRGAHAARCGFLLWKLGGPRDEATAGLRTVLKDGDARTRAEAADLLGRMGKDAAGAAKDLAACAAEPNPAARVFLAYAHYQVTGERTTALPVLEAAAAGKDERARAAAIEALEHMKRK